MIKALHLFSYFSIVFLLAIAACISSAVAQCSYRYDVVEVHTEWGTIHVEQYSPLNAKYHPLVFMLHGSAGAFSIANSGKEPATDNFGEKRLASACFFVLLPHYFEVLNQSSLTFLQDIVNNYELLLQTSQALLAAFESSQPTADSVFLYGESLGAYLAVQMGIERSEVQAVSEISGGIKRQIPYKKHHLAILISHGRMDTTVSIRAADHLHRYCRDHAINNVREIYDHVGHYFPKDEKDRVIDQTIAFFKKDERRRRLSLKRLRSYR